MYRKYKSSLKSVCVILILISLFRLEHGFKICKEKYIEQNIESADVILVGTVRQIERNYSSDLYGASIEIHRIIKGRAQVYELFNMNFNDNTNQNKRLKLKSKKEHFKRFTVTGNSIFAYNFGATDICESNVKPNDVRIFLFGIDDSKKLYLNSSVIQPISKELRNLNSLYENQFTDRCNDHNFKLIFRHSILNSFQ